MSTQVEINGINFLPIKDAAKLVSYSKDYVARLAREGKIVASQIGRQWFVDIVSLKNFAESSQLELSVRKQQLSLERKREQTIKQELQSIRVDVKSKTKVARLQAQLVAVFVLGFGLLAGAGIYTTTSLFPSQASSLARLGAVAPKPAGLEQNTAALDLEVVSNTAPEAPTAALVAEENSLMVAQPQATTLFNAVTEYPLFTDEAETRSMSIGNSEGIFLLARNGQMRNAEEVKSLFSDEVKVEFTDENSGVISYERSIGEVAEFPFVSVPVKETANEGLNETIE